jgi:CheY-like chemotaxis protein
MSTEKSESEAIAKKVRELMELRGIGDRKQTGELGRILNLGFSAAHRKINGESPWTVSQIIEVATHYNETPGALLDSIQLDNATSTANFAMDAVLSIQDREFSCSAQVSELLSEDQFVSFVAFKDRDQWRIAEMIDAPKELALYVVKKIEIHPVQAYKLSVAVIDDDENIANNIRDYLNHNGFKAAAFYSTETAALALNKSEFDAYVIDWFIGKDTSEGLLKIIRAAPKNSNAPIILLTGQISAGLVNDTEIAGVMRRYNLLCQEKPVRLAIISFELSKLLGIS